MNFKNYYYYVRDRNKKPLIIIGGSTASGKSSAAIECAQRLKAQGIECEIISADSRQIYKDIPIFSGAIGNSEMEGITHHLVGSTADLNETHSSGWFRKESNRLIDEIHARKAVPIVVGGSAFWLQSILFQDDYPKVAPNLPLRNELQAMSVSALQEMLQTLDPIRFSQVDIENPRRLIRSIEIAQAIGSVPKMTFQPQIKHRVISIYFDLPKEALVNKITANVSKRFAQGLLEEAQLVQEKISEKRLVELGLAYKHIGQFWAGELSRTQLIEKTIREEVKYAKRQKTFFKKMLSRLRSECYIVNNEQSRANAIEQSVRSVKSVG